MSRRYSCRSSIGAQEDLQSILGEPWEDLTEFATPAAIDSESSSLPNSASRNEDLCAIAPFTGGLISEDVPQPDESHSSSPEVKTERQHLPEPTCSIWQETNLTSVHTELALDKYLASYCQVQSSMEDVFTRLRDYLQDSQISPPLLEELLQRVADNRALLDSRSNDVEQAKLKRTTLWASRQQQHQLNASLFKHNSCSDVHPFDDDNKSSASSASDHPKMVEEYFEAARRAFVENERLEDLDDEYNELVAAREQDGDDEGLSESIAESEESYKRKRLELSGALAISHYRLDIERRACRARGINPERYRYRRFSYQ